MSDDAEVVALPLFPLNTVLFPGVTIPLHIFEDRYRALVHHLLRLDPVERMFGSVAIREGYEVGEHGAQSLYRIVGPDEFDREPGHISMDSPLGRALLRRSLDEEVTVELPGGSRTLVIVEIEYRRDA